MTTQVRALFMVFFACTGLSGRSPTNAGEPLSAKEAVQLVTAGIESNYGAFKTVYARMNTLTETPSSDGQVHSKTQHGIVDSVSIPKRTVTKAEIWIKGQALRVNMAVDGTDRAISHTDGVWTEHRPDSNTAWIRREMPAYPPIDPRSLATLDIRRDIVGLLTESRITSAGWQKAPKGGQLVAIDLQLPTGQKMSLEFDQGRAFLPTRSALWHADGTVAGVLVMEYEPRTTEGAFFLKRAVNKAFQPGQYKSLPDTADDWYQRSVTEVTEVRVNERFDSSVLTIELPAGTRVYDGVQNTVRLSGYLEPAKPGSRVPVIVVVLAIAGACLVAYVFWRYIRRTRTQEA